MTTHTDKTVALVSGAGGRGGIGRAIALVLARRGVHVALTDVERDPATLPPDERQADWQGIESVAAEVRACGVEAFTRHCDLRDPQQIEDLVAAVVGWHGQLDILVNNARALMGKDAVPVTQLSLDVWEQFFAINTTAPFLMIKAAASHMMQRGRGGRIVSIGSDMSKRALPNTAAYAASKFGVIGLTQAAAMDLAVHGITVNAVCPGPVRTNRFNYAEQDKAQSTGQPLDTVRESGWDAKGAAIPLGRAASVEDVAHLVGFLTSEEGGYITGQGYNVNGGMFFH